MHKNRYDMRRFSSKSAQQHEGKPQKNRFMCPTANKPKQLFQSEKEANTFLKFNRENLAYGSDSQRVYWCDACAGFHLSSKPYSPYYDRLSVRLIDAAKSSRMKPDWVSEARKVWDELPDDVKRLPRNKFRRYLQKTHNVNPDSPLYGQGLIVLYKQYNPDCVDC